MKDHIYLDCSALGFCSCSLQVTLQCLDLEETKYLYDQLVPLCPILVSRQKRENLFRNTLKNAFSGFFINIFLDLFTFLWAGIWFIQSLSLKVIGIKNIASLETIKNTKSTFGEPSCLLNFINIFSCNWQTALTAAAPIYRGYLSDYDSRWNVTGQGADDRTKEELECNVSHLRNRACALLVMYLFSCWYAPANNNLKLMSELIFNRVLSNNDENLNFQLFKIYPSRNEHHLNTTFATKWNPASSVTFLFFFHYAQM